MNFSELYEYEGFTVEGVEFRMPVAGISSASTLRAYKEGRLCVAEPVAVATYTDMDDLVWSVVDFFSCRYFNGVTALPEKEELVKQIDVEKRLDAAEDTAGNPLVGHRFHGEDR